ncbi:MAG TPA: hypothetical protein VGN17_22750 [Bryobacteraceae bacterium]
MGVWTRGSVVAAIQLAVLAATTKGQSSSLATRSQAQYTQIYSDDIESGTGPTVKAGLQLQGTTVITDPSQVIAGKGSLLLSNRGGFVSDPAVLSFAGNTVYTIKFDYRIVSPPTVDAVFYAWFEPMGATDPKLSITLPNMLKNAAVTGTYSMGAQTASASSYVLRFYAAQGVSLIVDNIFLFRQDVTVQTAIPASWSRLSSAPYPRLGKYTLGNTGSIASSGKAEGKPFTYTVEQIESRLAFFDVIAGLSLTNQTQDPDSIHRIRALNPNAVILPYRPMDFQSKIAPRPDGLIDLDLQLLQSTPDAWKATDTSGNIIYQPRFPNLFYLNLSDSVPAVNGQTWRTALPNFVTTQVFPSGLWDGVFFDGLNGALDGNFPYLNDPLQFNYDWNRNGVADETRAASHEMVRKGNMKMLQQVQASANGMQLIMGNTGPELALAPFVNGYTFECFNGSWNDPGAPPSSSSPARWRVEFDAFRRIRATSRSPQMNVLEACGVNASDSNSPDTSGSYLTPTPEDLQKHRFSLGTVLLDDGFYGYDLLANTSAPYWFDEYSVDSSGNAVEDRAKKGYLGQPLADAAELATPATQVFQEGFESGGLPNSFLANPQSAASISRTTAEVISGAGSLVISSPDHTKDGNAGVQTNPAALPLTAGVTYLLTLDWRILETIDNPFGFQISLTSNGQTLDHAIVPGVLTGDSGSLHFPFSVPSAGTWSLGFAITNGGGKVAIDNVRVDRGGPGGWRRDFENGFVLVNPFAQPRTFSAAELAGALHRTGIRRIKGTQAPDINNGLPALGDLIVGGFDAIVLLADKIGVASPVINSVGMAGGFPDIAQNGWIEIRGANLAPPGVALGGMIWDKAPSFESGIMPTDLGGVRVTVNGKPAFVYFASPNQVNVLSPLEATTAPVPIAVISGGVSSASILVNLRDAAPSFPLVGSTKYIVATHADNSLIGPATLSAPGYAFTPARAGETIVLYAFGLGLPSTSLVNGASAQSGPLPALPQVQIGGASATLTFAGVISPGLYQLNVMIPGNLVSGDCKVVLTYKGQNSPSGDLITIQ